MQFQATRSLLHGALQTVTRAVSGRSTLPILSNIHVSANTDTVTLAATDLELGIRCSFPAQVQTPGQMTVPAKTISEIVSQLREGEVTLQADERNTAVLKSGRSTYKILGLPAEDYPPLPEVGEGASFSVPQGELIRMIRLVKIACGDDENRPVLSSIRTSLANDRLSMVATETHCLAMRYCPVAESAGERTALIPDRALIEVLRLLEPGSTLPVQVRMDGNQVSFDTGSVQLVSRLIEGVFPKFERVIPNGYSTRIIADTDDLLQAVKRASIVAREEGVRLDLRTEGTTLALTAQAGAVGNAEEELEISIEGNALDFRVNWKQFLGVLGVIEGGKVAMEWGGQPNAPLVLRADGDEAYTFLTVPCSTQ